MPLELDPRYSMDYNIYMFCGEDISKKDYIEKNYNNEDFIEWVCLSQYHAHATKEGT